MRAPAGRAQARASLQQCAAAQQMKTEFTPLLGLDLSRDSLFFVSKRNLQARY